MVQIITGKTTQSEDKTFCECGCGKEVTVRINRNTKQPVKYKRGHHSCGQAGELNHNWKGGKMYDKNGYILVYYPTHPFSVGGYVFEHRLVMEQHIGRYLKSDEIVHHRNEVITDNRIQNLRLLTRSRHLVLHHGLRRKNNQLMKDD